MTAGALIAALAAYPPDAEVVVFDWGHDDVSRYVSVIGVNASGTVRGALLLPGHIELETDI